MSERRRLMFGKKITVTWNQLIVDNFTSNNYWQSPSSISVSDGILTFNTAAATSFFTAKNMGANATSGWGFKNAGYPIFNGNKYFFSVECKRASEYPSDKVWFSANATWSTRGGLINQTSVMPTITDNAFSQCMMIGTGKEENVGTIYPMIQNGQTMNSYLYFQKPMLINLTTMFGAGNEPTNPTLFKQDCLKNGIDLSSWQNYTAGTQRNWIV